MSSKQYIKQVDLLLDVLPIVAKQKVFALKGGTALNLFLLPFPRLSVDIDLCYLPIAPRIESMQDIHKSLIAIKGEVEDVLKCSVISTKPLNGNGEARLIVKRSGVEIKIEPNYIIRGAVFSSENLSTSEQVAIEFNKVSTITCLSVQDLYGGKICAALDRQHPRDLFDIKEFFNSNQIDAKVRDAFIYYLISHNRPFHELLQPHDKPIEATFEKEFAGMTTKPTTLEDLTKTRRDLKTEILSAFDNESKSFLFSLARNEPKWELFNYPKIKDYPSVKWRLSNIGKMEPKKTG